MSVSCEHFTIVPPDSRSGSARHRCQRYVESARFSLNSTSELVAGRSEGDTGQH